MRRKGEIIKKIMPFIKALKAQNPNKVIFVV
jgi:hypothetical protein